MKWAPMTENAKPLADNELGDARLPRSGMRSTVLAADAGLPTGRLREDARVAKRSGMREQHLDWNIVTLPPDGEIDAPGTEVDAMIHVLSGSGRLTTAKNTIQLAPGAVLWLPGRARPQFIAGPDGLRYLTVNQKWKILPP
ncbi:hypothetical protein MYCOZU2_02169 [Mycobacterium intracellulare subsp. chimaera]|uniref:Uncharacterized protein n=2 Tax=Mycobacterium intracellulare subsp. chimaera TaxID=222805 RepID=A0A220XT75_MYCIT|nr:hypothetical protein MYCOZU2_02169 [Mycobacterium intracellulare subsp. chimaera]OCB23702.1 hypothetical protein A5689_15230 [Mycobacterium intracellulare subsp. yongonense]ASQ85825.1 hypothetical protein CE197_09370 [Mycobacterium intracellulare subsp. chimaera]ASX00084.1 hypothetical protein CKJ58_09170 [Mycobacterium intracellulare subsp. chimaera]PBA55066.1 hypothetical protein CKJ57_10265 [Mycobacterium intracellulare subsp. chimaera]